jgi:hypothetical protein
MTWRLVWVVAKPQDRPDAAVVLWGGALIVIAPRIKHIA